MNPDFGIKKCGPESLAKNPYDSNKLIIQNTNYSNNAKLLSAKKYILEQLKRVISRLEQDFFDQCYFVYLIDPKSLNYRRRGLETLVQIT